MQHQTSLTPAARWLGYAGLLPQIACVASTAIRHELAYSAIAGGFAYAAAIFSFLGGVWWGQALMSGRAGTRVYLLAVMPSLIAVALVLPWTLGWSWPGPQLVALGGLILISPLVDRALGLADPAFMRLRVQLSVGLGALTIILGLLAEAMV